MNISYFLMLGYGDVKAFFSEKEDGLSVKRNGSSPLGAHVGKDVGRMTRERPGVTV